MKTLCIIQARLGSTRFPRKALADIDGKPMIWHVATRAKRVIGVDHVSIAVPSWDDARAIHDVLIDVADVGIAPVDVVAEADVLGRFAFVAAMHRPETVMRLTADCPLVDPYLADRVLLLYRHSKGSDYASNIAPGYVDGEDVEVFSADILRRAHRETVDPSDREHVTPWMRRNGRCVTLPPTVARPGLKTSVDTLEDLERVRAIVAGVTA